MTKYKIPTTEGGEVDWRMVQHHLSSAWGFETFNFGTFDAVIKAIDANARAEEREACAVVAENTYPTIDDHKYPSIEERTLIQIVEQGMRGCIAQAIRARGDSQ